MMAILSLMTLLCICGLFGLCCSIGSCISLSVVLCIPCLCRFMCHLAVAGLGLRFFSINFLLMFGYPFSNPFCTTFNSVEIFGLHNDLWANFTALFWVFTMCLKLETLTTAGCGVLPIHGPTNCFGMFMIFAVGIWYVTPS